MEIGHNTTYDLELIAWSDNDPGSRHQLVRLVSVQIIQNILQSFISCQPVIRLFVRHPLFDDQFIGCGIRIRSQRDTHIIEAFKRTDRSRADRICVLKDGGIVEQGNHEILLGQNGLYAHMWEEYNKSVSWKVGKGEK